MRTQNCIHRSNKRVSSGISSGRSERPLPGCWRAAFCVDWGRFAEATAICNGLISIVFHGNFAVSARIAEILSEQIIAYRMERRHRGHVVQSANSALYLPPKGPKLHFGRSCSPSRSADEAYCNPERNCCRADARRLLLHSVLSAWLSCWLFAENT